MAVITRRKFAVVVGGAAVWPLTARAQQNGRVRRIGIFFGGTAGDPDTQVRVAAFMQGLHELGWTVGRNARIEYRWGEGDGERIRRYATELGSLAPDVILAAGGTTTGPLQQLTHIIPIVFVNVTDPVSGGFVASLARPGGNATGFINFEYSISAKWLELLKEIAPRLKRVAVIRDLTLASGSGQLGAIQAVAPSFGVELTPVGVQNAEEIERALTAFAAGSNGGIIVTSSALAAVHRELIVALAARHRLPAVYSARAFVVEGGLICYAPDQIDPLWRAAGYVDRILKGEKPADLPVQTPTKYELLINLKTAKALGLDVPAQLLARADEVIELTAGNR
jgi:putative ABC transport system substrate-binding protein